MEQKVCRHLDGNWPTIPGLESVFGRAGKLSTQLFLRLNGWKMSDTSFYLALWVGKLPPTFYLYIKILKKTLPATFLTLEPLMKNLRGHHSKPQTSEDRKCRPLCSPLKKSVGRYPAPSFGHFSVVDVCQVTSK